MKREMHSRRHPARGAGLGVALAGALLLAGCAVQPLPLETADIARTNQQDRARVREATPAVAGALTLEEAVARALKYNLDHRVRLLEQALAAGQFDASRFDMLPRVLAEAGYGSRNNDNVRRATDSVTGAPSLANPFVSSERSHSSFDVGLTWNILDFGASYYNAKQNADRLLIADERRRKSIHLLIQNVRTAFWRALAAQKLGKDVQASIREAETALTDSRRVFGERVRAPAEALRYQRGLLDNLRLLEGIAQELSAAGIELANLVGAQPGEALALVEPALSHPRPLDIAAEQMEEAALTGNPDLREQFYNARIAAAETRRALLKLLPGISFDYTRHSDDDRYLINQQWRDVGVRVSLNLFNLLSGPSQMNAAELGKTVAEARRVALQMNLVAQVHLARQQYEDARLQLVRADEILEVDSRLAQLVASQEQSQVVGKLERISAGVTALLSGVRRYSAIARAQEAGGRIHAVMGREPRLASLDDTPLEDLSRTLKTELGTEKMFTSAPAAPVAALAAAAAVTAAAPTTPAVAPAPAKPAAAAVPAVPAVAPAPSVAAAAAPPAPAARIVPAAPSPVATIAGGTPAAAIASNAAAAAAASGVAAQPVRAAAPATAPLAAAAPVPAPAGAVGGGPIQDTVNAWIAAWSGRDINAFLSVYSPAFKPSGGVAPEAWRKERETLVAGRSGVQVAVDALNVQQSGDQATATFRQRYRSDQTGTIITYSKVLKLALQGGRWLIVEESGK